MDKILAPIKQRILKYLEISGIEKKKFFEKISVAASNFRSKSLYSEVGGDVIAKILSCYPDINPTWLLIGEGEMLKGEAQPQDTIVSPATLDALTRQESRSTTSDVLTRERIGRLQEKIELIERENSLLREMIDMLKARQ